VTAGKIFEGRLSELIEDRPQDGIFRVNRAIFDDPSVFELERRRIFEGGWVFLGIADQAPAAHDFFTTDIGRVPILVSRGADGALRGFVNSCPHRGSRIAQTLAGNARLYRHRLGATGDIDGKSSGSELTAFYRE